MSSPQIYVACLASYNNGCLHGCWIDANQPPDDLHAEVQAMLASSPESSAEEWAIHDYEGFGPRRLLESEPFERVSAIAAALVGRGDVRGA